MKRWLAFLFLLSAVWLLRATPEHKMVFPIGFGNGIDGDADVGIRVAP